MIDSAQCLAGPAVTPVDTAPATGRMVAVVGAGPAGMACAVQLALLGNGVIVYEARSRDRIDDAPPRLDGDAATTFARLVDAGRIRCEYGQKLGANLDLADLHLWHDAVFLGVGLASGRILGLCGDRPAGLADAGRRVATVCAGGDLPALPAPERAIVIGAGRGAVTLAARLKQGGVRDVTLALRQALAPDGADIATARASFVRVRSWVAPLEVLRAPCGTVEAMRFEQTRMLGGCMVHTGGYTEIAAHAVFKAVGRADGFDADPGVHGLSRDGERVRVDGCFRTALPGVYAGGDCVAARLEPDAARRHGELAARAIHADLLA